MKSLWHKIKILFVIVIASAMAYGLFQLSTLADNNLLSDARHAKPEKTVTEIHQEIATVLEEHEAVREQVEEEVAAIEALDLTLNSDSPEIVNSDYGWLQGSADRCHPTMKAELKAALKNDGIIRQNEYDAIMWQCNEFVQAVSAGDKVELKKFLAE